MGRMSNKPLTEFKSAISGVKLTGWEGDRGLSWNLSKRYKDKESGEWKESKYLTDWDLDAIASLVAQAKEFNAERRRATREAATGTDTPPPSTREIMKYNVADDDIPF
jgi:hypothetical protein